MSARLGTTSITSFNSRTSGRDLRAVRRPGIVGVDVKVPAKGDVKTEKPAPEPKAKPLGKSSPAKPEKNDGEVKVSDG